MIDRRGTPPVSRYLLVTADDFGIGPGTSRGILELAVRGAVTSAVLLVNSPFAAASIRMWEEAGRPVELGWHPCLTLDAPVLPPERVPSLVGPDDRFPRLGRFLRRVALGRVRTDEVEAEFAAQYRRFAGLTGFAPANVNAHHHAHVFRPVGDALARVLAKEGARPFVRRVVEPIGSMLRVPGARVKRAFLDRLGRRAARRQHAAGLPGSETLAGITDPPFVRAPDFFARWLAAARGRFVELSCHPGHFDPTLAGRDGTLADGHVHRRPQELTLLRDPGFLDAARAAGFELVTAEEMVKRMSGESAGALKRAG
jgi:predicted glycoside hydrolase/deacetylase ChbG (UPF0249 family)